MLSFEKLLMNALDRGENIKPFTQESLTLEPLSDMVSPNKNLTPKKTPPKEILTPRKSPLVKTIMKKITSQEDFMKFQWAWMN